jgi:dihydroorotate dehydrogenase (NAD+) catalytic subunit
MNAAGTLQPEALEDVPYGALVTKTITLEPRTGNPPPRLAETPSGMLNSVGLQNPGIEKFLEEELDRWEVGLPVIVSVGGAYVWDFTSLADRCARDERVSAIELNLSCPNVGRATVCSDPENIYDAVQGATFHAFRKPVIAKLSFANCAQNAQVASEAGASAVTLINTIPALQHHSRSSESILGGLSGPAIRPIALRAVYEVSQVVDLPILGCGGITTGADIHEYMKAGASAVQIGSGSFVRDVRDIVAEYRETL